MLMKTSRLHPSQLRRLCTFFLSEQINILQDAKKLGIARNTLRRHLRLLRGLQAADPAQAPSLRSCLACLKQRPEPAEALLRLQQALPGLLARFEGKCTVRQLWQSYLQTQPDGYRYSQFAFHYAEWARSTPPTHRPQSPGLHLPDTDQDMLRQWRRSADRRRWEKAVVLLDSAAGHTPAAIARKIERQPEKVRAWLRCYLENGLSGFLPQPRQAKAETIQQIALKKENLMRLLHEAPQLHGFNRTSWRLKDLSTAYQHMYSTPLSVPTISAYIRQAGYVFRKARKVLTSPDPDFREKLKHIQTILQHLGPKEKFFSVDEYGPFSVRMKGGRSRVRRGETKTYPQHQKSKGFLICTAALELSTNQLTHFYSRKKDTDEMIKLVELLRRRYHDQEKLYLSWDAAIWHASKKLKAHLEAVNADGYRAEHQSPIIELAPLPASAQFLNVIESVFSGLARAVIHHSDYTSVGHCQAAIDRYFQERNRHFALHPKKAGKKIWGQERTVAEFRDSHNCKDPAWR
ncbi:MAG: IS630 family transposase [Bacteroidota bacterium]